MKILFITHYSALYGANKSLINLIEGFGSMPVEFCVVLPNEGELSLELDKRRIKYIIQEFNWWAGTNKNANNEASGKFKKFLLRKRKEYQKHKICIQHVNELKHKLRDFKPGVVMSNSSVINFGFVFARKFDIPHVWFLRESQEQYYLKWLYHKRIIKRNFNRSDIIIAVSDFLKKYYSNRLGIKNIKTVYNGVVNAKDLILLDKRRKEKENQKNSFITFGIVGLLHPKKGQAEAINAFGLINKEFPETKLIIAGLGDQTGLRELVKRIGLEDKVEFWGHIEEPFEAFLEMDVYLMCSRMEGLGRVTLEAMASGLPVIGYYEGGTKDIILENETGLFYKKDHEDLAEKMRYLIRNPELRLKFGNNARALVDAKYTSEVYAENVYNLIKGFDKN